MRSFFGWATIISVVLHGITLPFLGLRAPAPEHRESEQFSVTRIDRPKATPQPPTPTPPSPTPMPNARAIPRLSAQPREHRHVVALRLHDRTTDHAEPHASDTRASSGPGSEDNSENGASSSAGPGEQGTAPGTPTPTTAPPSATPKPSCANPNAVAGISGDAVEPEFSDAARQQGEAGTTEVEVTLDPTGSAVDVEIHASSGFAILDRAALSAARATRYTPQIVDCVKTGGRYLFRADFTSE